VDLVVSVQEKPTGNLSIGAGYSQAEKLSFVAGIQQENVFGSGTYLGLNINTSKFNKQFSLTTVDPYFTPDGVSRAIDVYYRTVRPYNSQEGDYRLITPGASIRFGVPFTETDTVFFGIGIEQTKIEEGTNLPPEYQKYIDDFGIKSTSVPLTIGWARDNRDSALVPSQGRLYRLNGEAGIAADTRYVKTSAQFQQYFPITKQYTFAINSELGWGKGLGGKPFPLFKNFYGGGLGSVRGFEQGTLGPAGGIGGSKSVLLNAELIAPFPGAGNDRTLRMFGFVDVGNVFGENEKFSASDMRASVGVGISWISPVGPLRIAYAKPIRKKASDKPQTIQFQIGTAF
jgi:outer membrane protein insertion porin family